MAVNVSRLGEFLDLSPENIDRLVPLLTGPLPERARPRRKRIDYVALRAQYEQLLLDGACATQAALARHLGVSRVLNGIERKSG